MEVGLPRISSTTAVSTSPRCGRSRVRACPVPSSPRAVRSVRAWCI